MHRRRLTARGRFACRCELPGAHPAPHRPALHRQSSCRAGIGACGTCPGAAPNGRSCHPEPERQRRAYRWQRMVAPCLLMALFVPPGVATEGLRAQGKRWWRMAEPCLLMALFVTLGMLLPLAFPCTPTQCYIVQGATAPVCPPGVSPNVQCATCPGVGRAALLFQWCWVRGDPRPGYAGRTKLGCHGFQGSCGWDETTHRCRRHACCDW
jgi:hypothetical protein